MKCKCCNKEEDLFYCKKCFEEYFFNYLGLNNQVQFMEINFLIKDLTKEIEDLRNEVKDFKNLFYRKKTHKRIIKE